MKRSIQISLLLILIVVIAGTLFFVLYGNNTTTLDNKQYFKVDSAKVTEVKNLPQPKLDVYIPLRDQYSNSKHATALQTLRGQGDNAKPTCFNCHSAEYRLAPDNAKPEISKLTTSISCGVCHQLNDKYDYTLRLPADKLCVNCHTNGSNLKPGQAAHHPQKEMFLGSGALGVADIPSTKYKDGITCVDCHMANQNHSFKALIPSKAIQQKVASACMMCHADKTEKDFAQKVDGIQKQIGDKVKLFNQQLETLKTSLEAAKKAGKNVDEAQKAYDQAYTNTKFVESDKSNGVHNLEYAQEILNNVQIKLDYANKALNK